jgi:hypothetical protein
LQDEPDVYVVRWLSDPLTLYQDHHRPTIRLENKSEDPIALPDPKFLMIHAAIAKVLHSSGVGEYLDLVMNMFHPGSSPPRPGNFGGEDLELRLSVLSLVHFSPQTDIPDVCQDVICR